VAAFLQLLLGTKTFCYNTIQYNKALTMIKQSIYRTDWQQPYNTQSLQAAVHLAPHQQQPGFSFAEVFVKNGRQNISVSPAQITHLQAVDKYVTIYLSTGKKYLVRGPLNNVTTQLQLHSLVQVHKSFVINTIYIKAIKYSELFVCNTSIPVGRAYRHHLKKKLVFIQQ
jgi:DNA-binding LytR/AlgR family response regulator